MLWFAVAWKAERIVCVVFGVQRGFRVLTFQFQKASKGWAVLKEKHEVHSWRKWGTSGENLLSKVLYLFLDGVSICDSKKNPIEKRDVKKSPIYSIRFEAIRIPHVSALRWKKISALWVLCSFSVMSIYIYVYTYIYTYILSQLILTVAIASLKFLDL